MLYFLKTGATITDEEIIQHRKRLGLKWSEVDFSCMVCGTTFNRNKACESAIPKTCSKECYARSKSKPKTCNQCGKEYINYKNKNFCSNECYYQSKRGVPFSAEHKESLSRVKKGKPIQHLIDNKEEVSKKISIAIMGVPQLNRRGKNHHNYKHGGKAKWARQKAMGRVEYKEWRRRVYERDGHTCQICGKHGGEIHVDHIKGWADYPDLRYDINNGRVLCVQCHRKTSNYGRRRETNKLDNREKKS